MTKNGETMRKLVVMELKEALKLAAADKERPQVANHILRAIALLTKPSHG